jgi:alcohol dehydrogenase class IV
MKSFLQIPSRIHYGQGALESLEEIIKRGGAKSILLFTDQGLRKLNMTKAAEACIARAGGSCEIVDNVIPEPSTEDITNTLKAIKNQKADLIIGLGGGSVMDSAKLASVILGASYSVRDLLKDPSIAKKRCPTVMIPTTCGTGSEATCNAIVAVPEEETKKGIVNPLLIPDEVILDADFIKNLPKPIIASTGVDALAHCVECFTSNKATPLSDLYAAGGAKIIFHNIEKAYQSHDPAALQAMLLGALYGGVAITGSGTTAVHALAYPLGGKYHIAHGVSNAIMFTEVMKFNGAGDGGKAFRTRLAKLCDAVYPEKNGEAGDARAAYLIQRIAEIVKNTEIPTSLKKFGIGPSDLDFLVKAGSEQQRLLVNNMKTLSLEDIRAIYKKVI